MPRVLSRPTQRHSSQRSPFDVLRSKNNFLACRLSRSQAFRRFLFSVFPLILPLVPSLSRHLSYSDPALESTQLFLSIKLQYGFLRGRLQKKRMKIDMCVARCWQWRFWGRLLLAALHSNHSWIGRISSRGRAVKLQHIIYFRIRFLTDNNDKFLLWRSDLTEYEILQK